MTIITDQNLTKLYNEDRNNIWRCFLMKAKVDRDLCIGCGLCEGICPKVFQMDDENIAIVIVDEVPSEEQESAKDAADSCPVSAIEIEE